MRIDFPTILPRREAIFPLNPLNIVGKSALRADLFLSDIFLIKIVGKSVLRTDFPTIFPLNIVGKSALRADFFIRHFPTIYDGKIGPAGRFLPRVPKIFLLYLVGKSGKIVFKKSLLKPLQCTNGFYVDCVSCGTFCAFSEALPASE